MDLNDYWQENKRFVVSVTTGVVVFFIAYMILDSTYQDDINQTKQKISRLKRELSDPMFSAQDLDTAQTENETLSSAVDRLSEAVRFEARPEFALDPTQGSAANQYLRALTRAREELLPLANRGNLQVDDGLGMPKLSPTREAEIVRYLEALDLIDSTVRAAVTARVQRIDKIQIKLDPGLSTRAGLAGLGRIERTRVKFTMSGTSLALTRVLAETQRPVNGRVLHVDEVEMVPLRSKEDEVRLDLTLLAARLIEPAEVEN